MRRTDSYSIAHLREVIIAIKCFDQDEDAVFERLDEMRQRKIESDGFGGERGNVGFIHGAQLGRAANGSGYNRS